MIKNIINKIIAILATCLFWVIFPSGIFGAWLVKENTNLKFNWKMYWKAVKEFYNGFE